MSDEPAAFGAERSNSGNGRARSGPGRIVVIFTLVIAIIATAVTTILVLSHSGDNYHQAVAEAQHLLSLANIPRGATEVSRAPVDLLRTPAQEPGSDHLVDKFLWFIVRGSMGDVFGWIESHPPAGLHIGSSGSGGPPSMETVSYTGTPDTDAYVAAELEITATPDGPDRTALRVDGFAIWLDSKPISVSDRRPRIRITIDGGCPASLGGAKDVSNPADGLTNRLLPKEKPTDAIICHYGPTRTAGYGLVRRIDLTNTSASELVDAIGRIRLITQSGMHGCGGGPAHQDILAFKYRDLPDVDLWFQDDGCATLDNGYILVESFANPSFFQGFSLVMDRLDR